MFQHGYMDTWIMKSCGECGCGRACQGCSKTTTQGTKSISKPAKTHHTPLLALGGAEERESSRAAGSTIRIAKDVANCSLVGVCKADQLVLCFLNCCDGKRPSIGSPGRVAATESHSPTLLMRCFRYVARLVRLRRSSI